MSAAVSNSAVKNRPGVAPLAGMAARAADRLPDADDMDEMS